MGADDDRKLAHDLNNLLAVIINTAAFLKDEVVGDEARRDVEEISKAAQRAAELVRENLGPTARRAEEPAPATPATAPPPSAGQGTVLIVDDEPAVLQLSRTVLESAGYAVLTASSLGEAAQVGDGRRVDLLLTDLTLPDGSGTELAGRFEGTPVLYMSGDVEAQADLPLIVKPFGVDDLVGRVAAALA
jgi:CheY-like chemotaxis protein